MGSVRKKPDLKKGPKFLVTLPRQRPGWPQVTVCRTEGRLCQVCLGNKETKATSMERAGAETW